MEKESVKTENGKQMRDKIYPALNRFELALYVASWISLYFLAVMQVHPLSNENLPKAMKDGLLEVKKSFLTSRIIFDKSDFEWELWNHFFLQLIVYAFVGHFIVMRVCERINTQYRFHASAIYTIMFSCYFFGLQGFLFLFAQSFIMLTMVYFTESVLLVWMSSVGLIVAMHTEKAYEIVGKFLQDEEFLFVQYVCACSMCNLRYTAFCIEYCWDRKKAAETEKSKTTKTKPSAKPSFFSILEELVLYQLYFPLFVGGPVFNYDKFREQKDANRVTDWSLNFSLSFIFGLLRYTFWHFFLNFILYYMHFSSIHYNTRLLKTVPLLTLCGLALCAVQFFCMKYMVMYGLPHKYAVSDNFVVPGASHCVSAKHRFTDMWKYFDRGLHKWLVRYIYIPLGGSNADMSFLHKMLNSIIPFAFVYVWHGTTEAYFVWAALNWFGVFIEKVAIDIYQFEAFQKFELRYVSAAWSRRLRAVISTLPFSLLIVSNIYFLSGVTVGNIYMKRIYTEDAIAFLCIHFALYCGVQTSMELTRLGL